MILPHFQVQFRVVPRVDSDRTVGETVGGFHFTLDAHHADAITILPGVSGALHADAYPVRLRWRGTGYQAMHKYEGRDILLPSSLAGGEIGCSV